MKALSLWQPWATLVATGAKRIETRSWATTYRGPLAIHASKAWHDGCARLCFEEPFRSALVRAGFRTPGELPLGAILCVCRLEGCRRITPDRVPLGEERAFGDYREGRYAWHLSDVRPLREPIAIAGARGLWEWAEPEDLEELLA